MTQALTGLQWAVAAALVLLGVVTLHDWNRHRDSSRMWLAVAVGALAVDGVLGRLPGLTGTVAVVLAGIEIALFMAAAFAFVLFRDSLIPSKPYIVATLAALTTAVSVATFGVSIDTTYAGRQNVAVTGVALVVFVALLLTWSALVGTSILMLARASGSLPSVQRARLRALTAGFAGIVLAVVALALAAGAGPNTGQELGIEALVLLSMPLLVAAFSPPGWLRRVWREREETEFRAAVHDLLLFSPDAATLARRGVEWASRLLGGGGAVITLDSRLMGSEGLDDAEAGQLSSEVADVIHLNKRAFTSSQGPTAVVPLKSRAGVGYIAVVAGPFTPLFGDEELSRLGQYGVALTVALDRVHLVEGMRRSAELLDLAYDAVFSWDFKTRSIQYWNKAATQLYGYTAAEAAGKDPQILLHGVFPVPLDGIIASLSEYDHWEGELVLQTSDGRTLPISARWALQRDAAGEPLSVLEINRDISAEKRAADDLRHARDVAEQASNAKSEYLSRMSHELRTPLAAMLGFSDLLEMREPRADQMQAIDAIQRAGSHLLSLVNDVLDIARIESGRESLSLQPVDVHAALLECAGLVAPAAAERGIEISVRGDAGDGVFVSADRQRLNQVLLNLLSNAIKYGDAEGHVSLGAAASERDVMIDVTDDGPGLTEAEQRLLFQPFERLGAERSHVQGTGLGLALCRQLTTAMGGTLTLRSEKGEGATFTVRLNRASSTDAAALVRASPPAVLRHVVAECTVLYVEDNLATVALVESIFALRPNVRLLTAMQGGMAVELAREYHLDLVILDLHLPDINGEEVIKRLRHEPRTAEVPVVIYSADATERQVDRLLAAGAEAYLTKPARVTEFLGLLDRILGRSAQAATEAQLRR
ncbi:MAG: ATP-binding protein [Candidatus Dormibacter sp.]